MADNHLPVLVLQMQRLGDLVLCFPLLKWLSRRYGEHPLWVVAEGRFFSHLTPLSPHAAYIPADQAHGLVGKSFAAVLNLSIRPEAAQLAGRLTAEEKWGPALDAHGVLRIHGDWQLYRASLVNNNRYNRYHWAELNGLDCIAPAAMGDFGKTPRAAPSPRVGVFLGASEPAKKPSMDFYRALTAELTERGLRPVLFAGPEERCLGREVLQGQPHVAMDLCGRLSVAELAAMVQTLSLFITPDTGPMHLAAWAGARTLNLSLGNVNPLETGPFQPGHYVLQPRLSCAGCWGCARSPLPCRESLSPARTAALAKRLARPHPGRIEGLRPPGVKLLVSDRDEFGLYTLKSVSGDPPATRDLLREFWSKTFGARFGLWSDDVPLSAWRKIEEREKVAAAFRKNLENTAAALLRRRASGRPLEDGFWRSPAPLLRPLTGYGQMLLQNEDFGPAAWAKLLDLLDRVREISAP
ncbi:MAG: hypothetical protein PWQ57_64 [Desulfovibrionales bacterium]|nr:hypothetical protein [Desulfovibrionales bacterium]